VILIDIRSASILILSAGGTLNAPSTELGLFQRF
jgi:hypothetical protein